MTIATAVPALLLGAVVLAQNPVPPLACNLKAISAAQRPRYNELTKRLHAAMRNPSELPNGYAFTLDAKAMPLPEAAEWISMERLCCPFLTLQLEVSGASNAILRLTGPAGVKEFLEQEMAGGKK